MDKKIEQIISKVAAENHNYHEGECGDLVVTMIEIDRDSEAIGVKVYDDTIAHAIVKSGDSYYDSKGIREEDEIKAEWAYDRPVELVEFVKLEHKGDAWFYNGEEVMSAQRIHRIAAMFEE